MSDQDTAPPASLLALYVLGDCDGWLTVGEIADRIEDRTGDRPDYSTLRKAARRLADVDRILCRTHLSGDVEVAQYRHPDTNNSESGSVDTGGSPID